jgi:hypothetical protein
LAEPTETTAQKADNINPAPLSHQGGKMFESEQPRTKSNLITLAVVAILVLVILLFATWFYTRT